MTNFLKKLDEAAKQNGGWIKLDLTDYEHYAFYIKQMGGETHLENNCPNLYGLIRKTQKTGGSNDLALSNTDPKDTFYIEAVTNDLNRSVTAMKNSAASNTTKEGKISKTVLRYLETKSAVGVVTTMRDAVTGEQVKSYPVVYTDTKDIDCVLAGDFSHLAGKQQRIFKVSSTVTEVEETNGLAMLQAKYVATTTYTVDDVQDIVKSYQVLDPTSKNPSHTQVKISYDRDTQLPDYDYHYNNSPITDAQGKRHISVMLPVKIEMEVHEDYHIERLDAESGYRLYLDYPKGGMCHDLVDIERLEPVISSNGAGKNNVLTLNLPVDWENVLDFDKLEDSATANLNIYGEFHVIVQGNTHPLPLVISLSLKSSADAVDGPCDKKVLPIFMQWGCMHKDTLIIMEDASLKKVCEIIIGDKVLSQDGFAYPVTNIVTGPEKTLYQITTGSGKTVRLSSTHTVFLPGGPLPAKDVQPGQTVLTVNGHEKIVAVEKVEYNDQVYNLIFEKETSIYGDGFVIGDMQMQQTIRKPLLSGRKCSAQMMAVIEDLRRLSELKGENK
ncbi:MAG: Hint domain-containing protein [Desulfosporosinus sp.]|nr:Hint domain-containing protein [Desulfosporosinus sp.]